MTRHMPVSHSGLRVLTEQVLHAKQAVSDGDGICTDHIPHSGHYMYRQFNIQNSTLCPHCIYVFCIYLRTNSDLCHLQHKLIGFYNRDGVCLLRGTDWAFII